MPSYLDPVYGVAYSESYAEACAIARLTRPVLVTLEFLHSAFTEPARIVADTQNLTARLEDNAPVDAGQMVEFLALPIRPALPNESDEGGQAVQLAIDGVSELVAQEFDRALLTLEPIVCIVREYVGGDLEGPARKPPPRFQVSEGLVDETTVVLSAQINERVNKGFPSRDFLPAEYPGLTAA